MKLTGRETYSKDVVVEVNNDDLIRQLERQAAKICPLLNKEFYLRGEEVWLYTYTHPHNNDDVFDKREEPVTATELAWIDWLDKLKQVMRA